MLGAICQENVKMSKSRGNVIDPNDVVDQYGADVLRVYVLFMGDYEQAAPWNENSMNGCKRFLDRVWQLQDKLIDGDEYRPQLVSAMHKTIKKVTADIESMAFNTAIAAMMTLINTIYDIGSINRAEYKTFITLLNPFAPHITEEIFEKCGFGGMLHEQKWCQYDEALCVDDTVEIAVQVNGKIKSRITIAADADQSEVISLAKQDEKTAAAIDGKNIVKEIYVKGKLVNIVVK